MRRFFLLFLMNVAIASAAVLPDKELVINASDATSSCAIKGIRRITFQDGVMFVDMKDGSACSWDTDWINCVTLGEYEPGEETTVAGVALSASFEVKDNILLVDCCVSTAVQLCTCNGKVVYDGVCTGELSLDMNPLPAGIYLLKLNGCAYKILNR